jgi:pyridoxal phosphate enzyme (YggS family)
MLGGIEPGLSRLGSSLVTTLALFSAVLTFFMNATLLEANLRSVQTRIADAAERSGRKPSEVTLVAVTKRHPVEVVRTLANLGATVLGENYPQELWSKAEALADLPITWHHIGHLQGNKAKRTLPLVRFLHGVDSLKLLLALDELAGSMDLADSPSVCLQVNTSAEPSKHGWTSDGILAAADAIADVRRIRVAGLMTIAPASAEGDAARPYFAALREVRDRLAASIDRPLPELSMGMSGDFEAAILEGATLVRVGSALFEGVVE